MYDIEVVGNFDPGLNASIIYKSNNHFTQRKFGFLSTSLKIFCQTWCYLWCINFQYILQLKNINDIVIRFVERSLNDSFYYQHHARDFNSEILS